MPVFMVWRRRPKPPNVHERILQRLENIAEQLGCMERKIMATVQELQAAADALQVDVGNVQTTLQGLAQQIADLQAQIAAGGTIKESDLDPVLAVFKEVDAKLDAMAPDAPPA